MKHVVKESEPRLFAEWKGCANENWRPSWENLGGEPKKALMYFDKALETGFEVEAQVLEEIKQYR